MNVPCHTWNLASVTIFNIFTRNFEGHGNFIKSCDHYGSIRLELSTINHGIHTRFFL